MKLILRPPKNELEWECYYGIRYRLLRKPYGASKGEEKKPEDTIAKHLGLFLDNKLIGIGMFYLG